MTAHQPDPFTRQADHWQQRVDLALAFRWAARLNFHEAVANHFSVAVGDSKTAFLINPNQAHYSRIKASDLLLLDANDPDLGEATSRWSAATDINVSMSATHRAC